jgi:hypothetical protein
MSILFNSLSTVLPEADDLERGSCRIVRLHDAFLTECQLDEQVAPIAVDTAPVRSHCNRAALVLSSLGKASHAWSMEDVHRREEHGHDRLCKTVELDEKK